MPNKRTHGPRRGTRKFMKKDINKRGKISITAHLQSFEVGERVVIRPEPGYQKGIPSRRFFGVSGTIKGKRGQRGYIIEVKDGNCKKEVICSQIHLRSSKC